MMTDACVLELLTPCLAAGARPGQEAEIRATAVRGQLHWWFRSLGGFKALDQWPLEEQENLVFGSAGHARRQASRLQIRLALIEPRARVCLASHALERTQALWGSAIHYLLHPLQMQPRAVYAEPPLPRFQLVYSWRGDPALWPSIQALIQVFGHLGALGYRSRRAFGALAFAQSPPPLAPALAVFGQPENVILRQLPARDARHALQTLADWLQKWRKYGRGPNQLNPFKPALAFTAKDHDAGLNRHSGAVYRAALGLPIYQRYQNGKRVSWRLHRPGHDAAESHFASPVLLRPHRTPQGQWLALILFIDSHQWPQTRKVFLEDQSRPVSLDLYEAMKRDPTLKPFPPA